MNNKKGIVHIFPLFIIAFFAVGLIVSVTTIDRVVSDSDKGAVLHDSDEREDNSGSGSSSDDREETEADDETDDDNSSPSPEPSDDISENEIDDDFDELEDEEEEVGVRLRTESSEDEERVEVRLSETERVRVRTKDGERRIDVYQGGVKVRFEYKDGELIIKAESEDEEDSGEIDNDELFKIVDKLDDDDIKISTQSGRIALTRGNSRAVTDFPLSIDMDTNSLIVTTPSGEKTVSVLPDVAVQNLIAANTISKLANDEIEIDEVNGEAVYQINGVSDQRLLWLIPVGIDKKVDVSIETGETVNIERSFIDRILDIFSF